ncbi:hypothetical protein ACLKA7_000693 [Drosophila subpalustris]
MFATPIASMDVDIPIVDAVPTDTASSAPLSDSSAVVKKRTSRPKPNIAPPPVIVTAGSPTGGLILATGRIAEESLLLEGLLILANVRTVDSCYSKTGGLILATGRIAEESLLLEGLLILANVRTVDPYYSKTDGLILAIERISEESLLLEGLLILANVTAHPMGVAKLLFLWGTIMFLTVFSDSPTLARDSSILLTKLASVIGPPNASSSDWRGFPNIGHWNTTCWASSTVPLPHDGHSPESSWPNRFSKTGGLILATGRIAEESLLLEGLLILANVRTVDPCYSQTGGLILATGRIAEESLLLEGLLILANVRTVDSCYSKTGGLILATGRIAEESLLLEGLLILANVRTVDPYYSKTDGLILAIERIAEESLLLEGLLILANVTAHPMGVAKLLFLWGTIMFLTVFSDSPTLARGFPWLLCCF